MKVDDDAMLASYNDTMERASRLLKLLGCDDPKKATKEQVDAVMSVLLAPVRASGVRITEQQLLADHRKLTKMKKRQQV